MAQQYATDQAGNIWEVDEQGQPLRFVQGPSTSGGDQSVVAPNPMQAAKAAYEAPQAAATLARTQQQYQTTAATAPYDARMAAANASKAEAEAVKAQRDVAAQQSTANPQQQKLMQALADDEILAAINRARAGIGNWSTGYAARLPEMVQPQAVTDLSGDLGTVSSRITLDTLAKLKQASPTGASGLGSLTEREGALLRDSVAGLAQTQSPEKLQESLANVEKHYRNVRALMAGEDYRNPQVAAKYGIAQAPEPQQQMQLATGATRDEADPALRGVNARIRSMIGAGRPAKDIVAYMNSVQPGLGDDKAADVTAATRYHAQNPQVPLSQYAISVENRSVPMSMARQMLNTAAQSPVGAFATSAADALTANNLSRATSNPALARAGLDAIANENPVSSFLGTAAGGALAGAGIEGALPLRGLGALSRFRQPIADAVYGGVASASDDGTALGGAAEGVAGGYLGRLGTRALGNALRGVRNADVQGLRAEGVTMTPGAILGGKVKAREDRLSGFGGIGEDITARRRQSFIDMNRAAFRQSVPPTSQNAIGGYAEDGIEQLRQETRDAYGRALNGRSFDLTEPQFQQDVTSAVQQGLNIPRTGPEFGYAVRERIDPVMSNGAASGPEMQDVLQGLRDADFGSDAMGNLANNAAGNVRSAFSGMVNRQAPDVMPQLGAADTSYRRLNVLADAVGQAVNNEGIFSAAQLGRAARSNARRFNGPIAAATADRPFYDLQRAAQNVLPSKVPDSGTAGRIEAGGLFGKARAAARNTVLAPLYAEGTQPLINSALLDRTPGMINAGDAIARRARLGGLFGAPLLVDYGP